MSYSHARDGLPQLFPAGLAPRTFMAVAVDGRAYDAGPQCRQLDRPKAVPFQRTLAIALAEDIAFAHQVTQARATRRGGQIDECSELTVAGVCHEVGNGWQIW
jgi:hypothetical protein